MDIHGWLVRLMGSLPVVDMAADGLSAVSCASFSRSARADRFSFCRRSAPVTGASLCPRAWEGDSYEPRGCSASSRESRFGGDVAGTRRTARGSRGRRLVLATRAGGGSSAEKRLSRSGSQWGKLEPTESNRVLRVPEEQRLNSRHRALIEVRGRLEALRSLVSIREY